MSFKAITAGVLKDLIRSFFNLCHSDKSVNTHLYDEACYCPSSLKKFYFDFECPAKFAQMEEDFARFPKKIDLDKLFDAAVKKKWSGDGRSGEATAHVVIKVRTVERNFVVL